MKIKHSEIEIPESNPFVNCKLGRQKYADALTSIIGGFSEGFVLAINNEWGTGKTTFVKMFKQHLINNGHKTLYFNAWENDFDSNPLVALMAELQTITKKDNVKFKSLIKKGAVITKNLLPLLIKALAEKYIDSKILVESIEKLGESASEILKDEIEEYTSKKKGLVEFRKELAEFISENSQGKPLVFVIDELDRCKPTYAVDVLEQIKHFFNVPGIVFVLSIDKEQLCNAIKGYYGSEQINAAEYLKRFIDLEYRLPKPEPGIFSSYLFQYFNFGDFFHSNERKKHREIQLDGNSLMDFSALLFTKADITLRQQEKIFAHVRVVLNIFKLEQYVFPSLLIFLIYIKDFHIDLYKKIQAREHSTQYLLNELEAILPKTLDEDALKTILHTEALLATFYNNYYSQKNHTPRITISNKETGLKTSLVTSGLGSDEDQAYFKKAD